MLVHQRVDKKSSDQSSEHFSSAVHSHGIMAIMAQVVKEKDEDLGDAEGVILTRETSQVPSKRGW